MTTVNYILFPENTSKLSMEEIDRNTPPPLIFINKTKQLYFNDNKLLVSENNSDMSRVHIIHIHIEEILINKKFSIIAVKKKHNCSSDNTSNNNI